MDHRQRPLQTTPPARVGHSESSAVESPAHTETCPVASGLAPYGNAALVEDHDLASWDPSMECDGGASEAAYRARWAFDQVAAGNASVQSPDDVLVLPPELVQGVQAAWDASLPAGRAQEQGGIFVRNSDGSYEWERGAPGSAGAFTPNHADVADDETLVGVGHTHPYAAHEGGHTDVSFSGGDIGAMATDPDNLQVVQSGESRFLVSRTAEFDALLAGLDDAGRLVLRREIEDFWDRQYTGAPGTLPEAAEIATRATCERYHLLYYRGRGSALDRVETRPTP
ncbi:MAG: hypothetical protein JRJ84_20890 [Deltaproteobacteria bacterium]|nr:hypothetical protein [Deltaproteobacteria bacterium]